MRLQRLLLSEEKFMQTTLSRCQRRLETLPEGTLQIYAQKEPVIYQSFLDDYSNM